MAFLVARKVYLRQLQVPRIGELDWVEMLVLKEKLKFQAFSVFFICIALTSDMICFLFIPVHWLFFAASTYVWVQYVWHTGECSALWEREGNQTDPRLKLISSVFGAI